ncbi:C4-dicarboxylate TRAP transporter substrate-binding protein [Paracoccus sp. Z330]|uniref:C4-dicarboxylate TRAP transporter substrate-binding protein n=1 Tax=Paracoccus onchidii TaxID=3017813 RepID=A0ABT4ZIT2_9RHOB|nr:C4-dicarboxylate TRAP transporter substrate-binding protein [Paracoccus onchidii]MDB6179272.1 C4-dicarboxylate TRAP transporter substrate-binding protein [Paracoccus onchidii]
MGYGFTKAAAGVVLSAGIVLTANATMAADYEIRLGHVTSDKEPVHQAMEEFARNVAERTDGQVEISIYPNGTLGTNLELYEQIRAGAPIMTAADPAYLADFVADFGVLGGPYLIDDPRDFTAVVTSDLFTDMTDRLRAETGIELLAMNWFFGQRHMLADKPISSPADLDGMTFRVLPNKMWIETFDALGARPTQLPWPEVYSGLSAGVVEGAEAPLPSIYGAKLHEVKSVISLTGHFKAFTGLIMNADYLASLPEDIQVVLKEEALAAGDFMTDLMLSSQEEWEQKLTDEGVTFNRDVDTEAFRQATLPVYDQFPDWTDGLHQSVVELLQQ